MAERDHSGEPYAWIEERIGHVDENVGDHVESGGQNRRADDDGRSPSRSRPDHELPDALEAEDRFGDDHAAEESPDIHPELGDDRASARPAGRADR